jgi:ABC-2 type transport system ATP-binding protein
MEAAIAAQGLRKRFGSFDAVQGIDLIVKHGEVLGFLGPNGAGKSTTMRMITGFLAPTAGSVRLCGTDMLAEPLRAKEHP